MIRTSLLGALLAIALGLSAQDTMFAPREQQIPPPGCMNLHNAWDGPPNPCSPLHPRALARRPQSLADRAPHPHRLRSFPLQPARIQVDAIQLHAAADDGPRSLLLRSRLPGATQSIDTSTTSRNDTEASTPSSSGRPIPTWVSTTATSSRWSSPCREASKAFGKWLPTSIAAACASSSP